MGSVQLTSRLGDDEVDLRKRSIQRAERNLERVQDRSPREKPPRIEQIRNRANASVDLVRLVVTHLDTLRDIAYDRTKAAQWRDRVKGGDRDFALDTNGDMEARRLYHQVAHELLDLLDDSTTICHDVATFMRDGKLHTGRRRTGADITADELAVVLEVQRRRIANGESSTPAEEQPTSTKRQTVADLIAQLAAARGVIAKIHPRLTKAERSRLTPREQQAWQRAVPDHLRGKPRHHDPEAEDRKNRIVPAHLKEAFHTAHRAREVAEAAIAAHLAQAEAEEREAASGLGLEDHPSTK